MRIQYSEDEDFPGQFSLWQGNCDRSLHGKKGQSELRVLRDALIALPEKRLILGMLEDGVSGEVCGIGAYGRHKGLDLKDFDPEDSSDKVGIAGGMPPLVAWKVVEINDVELEHCTPKQRYERMLAWVEGLLNGGDGLDA